MDMSVDWGTKVIYILKLYLDLDVGTIYKLDSDKLRLDLKDLEDDEEGIAHLDTHQHNPEITIAGVIYAKTIEIINGYSVEFEDGQYTVIIEGSNNNFHDVLAGILVQNQVQVIPTNAAGLIVNVGGAGATAEEVRIEMDDNSKKLGLVPALL